MNDTFTFQDELINDLARGVVTQLAPQELPLFDETRDEYLSLSLSNRKAMFRGPTDADLGFGFDPTIAFLTPVIFNISHEVVTYILSIIDKAVRDQGADTIRKAARQVFKNGRENEDKLVVPSLTREQLEHVNAIVHTAARRLKIPSPLAQLLADTIIANLVMAAKDSK